MFPFFFLSFYLMAETTDVLFIQEQVEVEILNNLVETTTRDIYFNKRSVRINELDQDLSYIIWINQSWMIVLDHKTQSFSHGEIKHDRNLVKLMLKGLGYYVDGKIQRRAGTLSPTGLKRKISEWQCQEFKLNYPSSFGVATEVWCTSEKTILSKNDMQDLWYAMLGNTQPQDVNVVVTQFFRDIPGIPIQFVTKVDQQDAAVTLTSRIIAIEIRQMKNNDLFEIPNNYRVNLEGNAP